MVSKFHTPSRAKRSSLSAVSRIAYPEPVPLPHVEILELPTVTEELTECSAESCRCGSPVFHDGLEGRIGPHRGWGAAIPAWDLPGLAWFRWIIGHQIAFIAWRLLADSLRRHLDGAACSCGATGTDRAAGLPTVPTSATAGDCTGLADLGTLMFLYTGSCSPRTYHRTIRPAMCRQHPAFSGEWAVDYHPLPRLARRMTARDSRCAGSWTMRWRLQQRVHMAVAARLVPDGPSLLRRAGRSPRQGPTGVETALFDQFFGTRRRSICRRSVNAQLYHRIRAVLYDLERHGLYPHTVPVSANSTRRADQAIADLEFRAPDLLTEHADALLASSFGIQAARRSWS